MTSETSGSGDVVQVITKSGEACAPPTSTVEMEDPFDDPALVTNAFLDIMWQDSHGNSALMLAAAENRILHVKGILTMAVERGTLWQMLEMRNEDGLTALEMAVRAGSDTCATLITKFAKEAQKSRPRLRGMFNRRASNEASENDITIEFDDAPPPQLQYVNRRPSGLDLPLRRLSRDKIMNNLKRVPPSDGFVKMNRSWPAQNRIVQRTLSGDSLSQLPSPSHSHPPPTDASKTTSVSEKLRSIFSSKKHAESDPTPVRRPQEYKKGDQENRFQGDTMASSNTNEQKISVEEVFRSPWPQGRPTRLPPLINLRRRTASEGRIKPGQEL
ncbi:hypothetical protein Y032_0017g3275 [Ancylostoma ceylanicum]|uniref:Ankyrin repeat protein n=1 Tax=Ancylostoma ceylanicum TaxID=53326 RepID=A0A016V4W7_9BILA|nr:hypothetical protein Y032_0017g3275 [Ancylostoma ceylanicum]